MRMGTPARRLASVASWLLVLGVGFRLIQSHLQPASARPLRFACWYWHRPFHLSANDRRQLRQSQIERLYVYAGTVVAHEHALQITRVQQWSSAAPCKLYPVLRVHPAANGRLL